MKYNSHTIKFILLKYTISEFSHNHGAVQPSSLSNFGTRHHPKKKSCIQEQPLIPPHFPPACANHYNLLSVSVNLPTLDTSNKHNCLMQSFMTGFYQLVRCFQGSSTLWLASGLHSFLCLNNIPEYGHSTFCLSSRWLTDIWVVTNNMAMSTQGQVVCEEVCVPFPSVCTWLLNC